MVPVENKIKNATREQIKTTVALVQTEILVCKKRTSLPVRDPGKRGHHKRRHSEREREEEDGRRNRNEGAGEAERRGKEGDDPSSENPKF